MEVPQEITFPARRWTEITGVQQGKRLAGLPDSIRRGFSVRQGFRPSSLCRSDELTLRDLFAFIESGEVRAAAPWRSIFCSVLMKPDRPHLLLLTARRAGTWTQNVIAPNTLNAALNKLTSFVAVCSDLKGNLRLHFIVFKLAVQQMTENWVLHSNQNRPTPGWCSPQAVRTRFWQLNAHCVC